MPRAISHRQRHFKVERDACEAELQQSVLRLELRETVYRVVCSVWIPTRLSGVFAPMCKGRGEARCGLCKLRTTVSLLACSQKKVSLRIQLPKYAKKDDPLTLSSHMLLPTPPFALEFMSSSSLRCVRDRTFDSLRVRFDFSMHSDLPAAAAAAADIRQWLLQNTLSCMKNRFFPEPKRVLQAQHENVLGEACGLPPYIFIFHRH